ncbi:outer membrane beta-barrel protein [Hyphococcus flavus]|uniref:Outer membrane beta-barrel protein n=1 Tax=Hyphococcus flavus TaxID=1866326 RepID=A0AAF0CEN2_9PROT|nr:OmpW family outer membrane protein [Hyphococcus flavus]WDI30479.1 outer membrane beta-barrel protein [Hyphococcus flavus]
MLKRASSLALSISLITGGAAQAEDNSWYASGQFGVRAVEREEIRAPSVDIDFELHNGLYASGAIGKIFDAGGVNFRLEAEAAWREGGDIRDFNINGVDGAAIGDGISAVSFMANGIIDIKNRSRFTPYFGGGIGVAKLSADISDGANMVMDKATSLSAQGIVGVDIGLSENFSVFTDLRYFKSFNATMTLQGTSGTADVDVDYDAYTFGVGLKYKF